jgi:hypothetical protein
MGSKWDQQELSRLVQCVTEAEVATEKGKTLEDLLDWFFSQFPGITIGARRLASGSEELDLVLFNDRHCPVFRSWGHEILIEAKNWSSPVDAAAIIVFLSKLRNKGIYNGILVARSGVTGMSRGYGGAVDAIKEALPGGFRPIVLTLADIASITEEEAFYTLLRAKQCQLLIGQV